MTGCHHVIYSNMCTFCSLHADIMHFSVYGLHNYFTHVNVLKCVYCIYNSDRALFGNCVTQFENLGIFVKYLTLDNLKKNALYLIGNYAIRKFGGRWDC